MNGQSGLWRTLRGQEAIPPTGVTPKEIQSSNVFLRLVSFSAPLESKLGWPVVSALTIHDIQSTQVGKFLIGLHSVKQMDFVVVCRCIDHAILSEMVIWSFPIKSITG